MKKSTRNISLITGASVTALSFAACSHMAASKKAGDQASNTKTFVNGPTTVSVAGFHHLPKARDISSDSDEFLEAQHLDITLPKDPLKFQSIPLFKGKAGPMYTIQVHKVEGVDCTMGAGSRVVNCPDPANLKEGEPKCEMSEDGSYIFTQVSVADTLKCRNAGAEDVAIGVDYMLHKAERPANTDVERLNTIAERVKKREYSESDLALFKSMKWDQLDRHVLTVGMNSALDSLQVQDFINERSSDAEKKAYLGNAAFPVEEGDYVSFEGVQGSGEKVTKGGWRKKSETIQFGPEGLSDADESKLFGSQNSRQGLIFPSLKPYRLVCALYTGPNKEFQEFVYRGGSGLASRTMVSGVVRCGINGMRNGDNGIANEEKITVLVHRYSTLNARISQMVANEDRVLDDVTNSLNNSRRDQLKKDVAEFKKAAEASISSNVMVYEAQTKALAALDEAKKSASTATENFNLIYKDKIAPAQLKQVFVDTYYSFTITPVSIDKTSGQGRKAKTVRYLGYQITDGKTNSESLGNDPKMASAVSGIPGMDNLGVIPTSELYTDDAEAISTNLCIDDVDRFLNGLKKIRTIKAGAGGSSAHSAEAMIQKLVDAVGQNPDKDEAVHCKTQRSPREETFLRQEAYRFCYTRTRAGTSLSGMSVAYMDSGKVIYYLDRTLDDKHPLSGVEFKDLTNLNMKKVYCVDTDTFFPDADSIKAKLASKESDDSEKK